MSKTASSEKSNNQGIRDGNTIYIIKTIAEGEGLISSVSAHDVLEALKEINERTVNVRINSQGGDVFEGIAIENLFKHSGKKIHVYIDGIAASAASIIAMAGDTITMYKDTLMMIHRVSTFASGNKKELEQMVAMLDKVDTAAEASYLPRFKGSKAELDKLLDAETWLSPDDAKCYGLCDEITEPAKGRTAANVVEQISNYEAQRSKLSAEAMMKLVSSGMDEMANRMIEKIKLM